MRIAIISTPRSGNTWIRLMFMTLFKAEEIIVHSPDDIDWENLSAENYVVQLHWHRTEQLKSLLMENDFNVVVLKRHPLDVLLSILQFAHQEPQTVCWLDGEGGDEEIIYRESPVSEAFLKYATGPRARALLSVSSEWGGDPDSLVVRYEDLVSDTQGAFSTLLAKLGLSDISESTIAEIVESNSIDKLRATSANGHFWYGKSGLWQKVIPFHVAQKIALEQQEIFSAYGYRSLDDTGLTTEEAQKYWTKLCR